MEEYLINKDDDYRLAYIEGAEKIKQLIKDFLYEEITERRDYSASKMCEVIISKLDEICKQ